LPAKLIELKSSYRNVHWCWFVRGCGSSVAVSCASLCSKAN